MFKNRKEGGEKLALALSKYKNENALVLGIPRGGVETAYYVAKYLQSDFSFVVTRKLGYPHNPEAAFGALAEDGSYFLFDEASLDLAPEEIQAIVEQERTEIRRRVHALRNDEPIPAINGRTVIIVDDGIATGATLYATIALCKNKKAAKIVVAAPVAGEHMKRELLRKVHEVVILYSPPMFYAVSQGYQSFYNLTDQEVLNIMKKWKSETVTVSH
jgi:predicted phosphoribosyltransferase